MCLEEDKYPCKLPGIIYPEQIVRINIFINITKYESIGMLEKILLNFSEDELHSLLPKAATSFITQQIDYVDESRSELYKNKLASLVATMYGSEFIFNDKLRKRLIESLRPSMFIDIFFTESKISEAEVSAKQYDIAIDWAKHNLEAFAKSIGLGDDYSVGVDQPSSVEGIVRITPNYQLYDYQERISKDVFINFSEGKDRQIIHLPTGAGKTRTAMNIASEHLRKSPNNLVLWLADREELCTQAFEEFKIAWNFLGNRATSAYGVYSDSIESLSGVDSGFVVAGLQKLLSIRKSDSQKTQLIYRKFIENVSLVIFDEAHKAVAPMFRQVVEDFIDLESSRALFLGLTATPGRSFSIDGITDEDKALSDFFHGNKVSMKMPGYLSPIDYLVEQGYLAKANFKSLAYDQSGILAYELSDAGGPKTMKALAGSRTRNKQILDTIKHECEAGSSVIVFACTVDHAVGLAASLSLMGIKAASLDSKYDTAESRRAKIQQYKEGNIKVLTNFNVLTAGFDAPITNVALIAKPMNSLVQYLQMAGRAMRGYKSGGNRECRIYTVMDEIPQFKSVNMGFSYWNEMWQEEETI